MGFKGVDVLFSADLSRDLAREASGHASSSFLFFISFCYFSFHFFISFCYFFVNFFLKPWHPQGIAKRRRAGHFRRSGTLASRAVRDEG